MKKLYFKHQLFKKRKKNNNLFNTKFLLSFIYLFIPSSLFSGHKRNIKGVN